jgi:hypothetical protein
VLTPKIGVVTYCAFASFSVALLKSGQEHHRVYMALEAGQIFNRSQVKFEDNFELFNDDVQSDIVPKEPHE